MSYYLTTLCLKSKIHNKVTLNRQLPQIIVIGCACYLILMLFIHSHWFALIIPMDILYTIWKFYPMVVNNKLTVPASCKNDNIYPAISTPSKITATIQAEPQKLYTSTFDTKYKPSAVEINDTLKYTVHNLGI